MTKRRRSYTKEFDHWVMAGIGDHQYNDGYDDWDEIVEAFNKIKEDSGKIPLKRSHGDVRDVGFTKYWDLDKCNKKVYIGVNDEDVDGDLKFNDKEFNVSIEYETDILTGKKIIGVNHIAMGTTFIQKCPKDICKIVKQRGDEPDTENDPVDVPDDKEVEVPDEPKGSEEEEISGEDEITTKILYEEIKLLKSTIEELSKVKDEPESDPEGEEDEKEKQDKDTKLKLGVPDKIKHDLPSSDTKPKTGYTPWKFIGN